MALFLSPWPAVPRALARERGHVWESFSPLSLFTFSPELFQVQLLLPSPRFALETEGRGPSGPACQDTPCLSLCCSMVQQRLGPGRMQLGNQLQVEGQP